jgi:hypothetical protein
VVDSAEFGARWAAAFGVDPTWLKELQGSVKIEVPSKSMLINKRLNESTVEIMAPKKCNRHFCEYDQNRLHLPVAGSLDESYSDEN